MILRAAVAGQVVEGAAVLGQEVAVAALADLDRRDVHGEESLEIRLRGVSAHVELAHVADVENGGALARLFVFDEDALVLDGHIPAAERGHARAHLDVGLI